MKSSCVKEQDEHANNKGKTQITAWDPWCAKTVNAIIHCQELLAPATPNGINQSSPTSFLFSCFWAMELLAYLSYFILYSLEAWPNLSKAYGI